MSLLRSERINLMASAAGTRRTVERWPGTSVTNHMYSTFFSSKSPSIGRLSIRDEASGPTWYESQWGRIQLVVENCMRTPHVTVVCTHSVPSLSKAEYHTCNRMASYHHRRIPGRRFRRRVHVHELKREALFYLLYLSFFSI